ncbi:PP0621 family protein [Halomonas cupida]|uniref:MYND finger n=1 Tax=Halomonas cupida TaxID=44933 RepID=A0A1M7KJ80_9GAMM|nr:PP0621 family protein [Halomonas cupida]GEN25359.1 hypothetical protein HCU01_33080 [Halomonas cupida]SHM65374.1 uncharacterized protein SAMN05660971_03547 [Halomonas cupida]
MNLLIIRLIIFAVVLYAGLKLYRMYREWKLEHDREQIDSRDGGSMVRCSWCKVHVPEQEAMRARGEWFCCGDHRDKFLAEQSSSDDD